MNSKQFALLDSLVLDNKEEFDEWQNPRMDKGYSFEYVKSKLFGFEMNTAIKCIEDGQYFYFRWIDPKQQQSEG